MTVYLRAGGPAFNRQIGAIAFAMAVAVVTPQPAGAHAWYPQECCNDQDCFPADDVEMRADGSMIVTVGPNARFRVTVPPSFPLRPSQDPRVHVCIYRDVLGRHRIRCVFVPGIG